MDLPPPEFDDLHQVLALLADLATSTEPVAVRKRQLAEELAELIGADVWVWLRGGRGGGLSLVRPGELAVGGGWKDGRQKRALLGAMGQRGWRELWRRAIVNGDDDRGVVQATPNALARTANGRPSRLHVTRARRNLIVDEDWYDSAYYNTHHAPAGVDDFLISAYPLNGHEWSTLLFWRRRGAPAPFSERDRHIVHLVAAEVDGLHRLPSELVVSAGDVKGLSPRQHQVLQLLLRGEGNRAVARRLRISEHTVCDYVKALHVRFQVHSRGQLLARFVGRKA